MPSNVCRGSTYVLGCWICCCLAFVLLVDQSNLMNSQSYFIDHISLNAFSSRTNCNGPLLLDWWLCHAACGSVVYPLTPCPKYRCLWHHSFTYCAPFSTSWIAAADALLCLLKHLWLIPSIHPSSQPHPPTSLWTCINVTLALVSWLPLQRFLGDAAIKLWPQCMVFLCQAWPRATSCIHQWEKHY